MSFTKGFQVKGKTHLSKIDPGFTAEFRDEEAAEEKMLKHANALGDLQNMMYAEGKHSLLVVLQGLDASGKDGTVKHVLGAMNPQGTQVYSFKEPTKEELAHDFLWRVHKQVPGKGAVTFFNRSHYEDVVVSRVHKLVDKSVWSRRFQQIKDFEDLLHANGTRILKFYLHISPEEQLRRFADRLEDPSRCWKIAESDYRDRKLWPQYIEAYEDVLDKTSQKHAPWFVIPSDKKWFRNLAIAKIIKDTMEDMDIRVPKPTVDIAKIRKEYLRAKKS